MRQYKNTYKATLVFMFDEDIEHEYECDLFPLIIKELSKEYGIDEDKLDKFLYDFDNTIEDYMEYNSDDIKEQAIDYYQDDAWEDYCNMESKADLEALIREDNLRRI